jgi:hypothetical protein
MLLLLGEAFLNSINLNYLIYNFYKLFDATYYYCIGGAGGATVLAFGAAVTF